MRKLSPVIALFCWLIFSTEISAAEVLQVRNSTVLQLGDNNRAYTVRISCIEVDPLNEDKATQFLKTSLPRHKKVNLKPQGSNDGVLLARVITMPEGKDLSKSLSEKGLGEDTCEV